MTFGVVSYHLVVAGLLSAAAVPVVYAGVMAVGAVPALAFADRLWPVLLGLGCWALASGIQDSTVKALVSELVPRHRLATAYGWFASFQGAAALAGGAAAGALYAHHLPALVASVWLLQAVSLGLLVVTVRRRARRA
jgi:MFS family permease